MIRSNLSNAYSYHMVQFVDRASHGLQTLNTQAGDIVTVSVLSGTPITSLSTTNAEVIEPVTDQGLTQYTAIYRATGVMTIADTGADTYISVCVLRPL